MKHCFFFTSYFLLTTQAFAQSPLTATEQKDIKSQAIQYIRIFYNTMEELGSSNNLNEKQKSIMVKYALSYFKKDATIEVVSNSGTRTNTLNDYLKNVVASYNNRFSLVVNKIEVSSFNLDHLTPVYDKDSNIIAYKGSYSYVQYFYAKKGPYDIERFNGKDPDSYTFADKTWKTGEVIIEKRFSPTVGSRWIILLGNINATKREILKN